MSIKKTLISIAFGTAICLNGCEKKPTGEYEGSTKVVYEHLERLKNDEDKIAYLENIFPRKDSALISINTAQHVAEELARLYEKKLENSVDKRERMGNAIAAASYWDYVNYETKSLFGIDLQKINQSDKIRDKKELYYNAARMWEEAGNLKKAAKRYEKAGKYEDAIGIYKILGLSYKVEKLEKRLK